MPDPSQSTSITPGEPRSASWFTLLVLGTVLIFIVPVAIIGAVAVSNDGDGGGGTATASRSTTVELAEFSISGDLTVGAGNVTIAARNVGAIEHNLGVKELDALSPNIGAGGTTQLTLDNLAPGFYTLYCEIPGHEAAGMSATLTVLGDGGSASPSGGGDEEVDWDALDKAMTDSIKAYPASTEGVGNPMLEPVEVLSDGTKVFELTAKIAKWEVEPGRIVDAWTYNGVVPAPQIWVDQGDKVQVRVTNDLPMGTDIHWHGVHTPNDQDGVAPITQDLIPGNGGEFVYEFTAEENAIGMYHAHHHAQMQVINGMFGVFRIGENPIPRGVIVSGVYIPDDLEVAVDVPMILNDAGVIGYSINGKSFPATELFALEQGDWASVTYYNEGLQIHPMHMHQFPQLVYAKDGVPLDAPYWTDTLNVAPGERYTILFRADDPGVWVWHCHILTHVEREEGMFGMVTAIAVTEVPGFDQNENPVKPSNFLLTPDLQAAQ
jgi:plastocyanin/nitrate reductase NapE component